MTTALKLTLPDLAPISLPELRALSDADLVDAIHRDREAAEQAGGIAQRASQQAAALAARVGAQLLQAKARAGHGGWLPWLAQHWEPRGRSKRTAQVYMQIADAFGWGEAALTVDDVAAEPNAQRAAHLPLVDANPKSIRQALAVLAPEQPPAADVQDADFTVLPPAGGSVQGPGRRPEPSPEPPPPPGLASPRTPDLVASLEYDDLWDDDTPAPEGDDPADADDYTDPDPVAEARVELRDHPIRSHAIATVLRGDGASTLLAPIQVAELHAGTVSHEQHVLALLRDSHAQLAFKLESRQLRHSDRAEWLSIRQALDALCGRVEQLVTSLHGPSQP